MNVHEIRPFVPPLITPSTARPARPVESAPADPRRESPAPRDVLSGPEKEFFANAFPSSATDLRAPAAYQKDGAVAQGGLGRMIDRKG